MKIITAIALAALVATPALAAGGKKKPVRHYHNSYNQMGYGDRQFDRYGRESYTVRSYSGRRVVGRDPDPNVRQSLRDEDAYFRRGD